LAKLGVLDSHKIRKEGLYKHMGYNAFKGYLDMFRNLVKINKINNLEDATKMFYDYVVKKIENENYTI
jgi:hypothetical protein